MKNNCPYCNHQLSIKEVLAPSVITCRSCGNKSYLGNFIQWLSIALLNLGILFLLLFSTASIEDEAVRKGLVYCVSPIAFLICVLAFIKPVKLKITESAD
ncbi:hypothetical protein [Thalassotalea litorea]|uniref:hypothetical protein n=1 Tax=Thalassotalea litorea TaxID=2020715 RepID=UPI0037361623